MPDGGASVCEAPEGDASVDGAVFTCCVAFLQPYTPTGFQMFGAAAASDPRVHDCCQAVVLHVDQDTQDYGNLPDDERFACCNLLDTPIGPACTPWGPPVPPEMPEAWIERAEAA